MAATYPEHEKLAKISDDSMINRPVIEAVLDPLDQWAHKCHTASVAIVRSGVIEGSRVARGHCEGVGVHSWVVVGDPYDRAAPIIDPTLWSYVKSVRGIWYGNGNDGLHTPANGWGNIFDWGKPAPPTGPPIPLTPSFDLSKEAQIWVELLGPLDRRGWQILMHAPTKGWPAGEFVAAMDDTPELEALVPIDLLGMLTDRNPGAAYLAKGRKPRAKAAPVEDVQPAETQTRHRVGT